MVPRGGWQVEGHAKRSLVRTPQHEALRSNHRAATKCRHAHELCERTWVTRSSVTVRLGGRVLQCPFASKDIAALKLGVTNSLRDGGHTISRSAEDRTDIPIDFIFPELLLKEAEDPGISLDTFASGVRVGLGSRIPRCWLATLQRGGGDLLNSQIRWTTPKPRLRTRAVGEESVRLWKAYRSR